MLVWSDFYNVKLKYKLHHEVQVSSRFTYRGPQAQGCVNHEETEPSDVTDLYQGYVALTTHLRPSNYSAGHKKARART